MITPITPNDVSTQKEQNFPDIIIDTINKMIAQKWDGYQSNFKQKDIVTAMVSAIIECKMFKGEESKAIARKMIFDNNWLDFEEIYRKSGWKVVFDKPGYNETYEANFTFTRKR